MFFPDKSLSPTEAAQAAIVLFAAHRFADVALPEHEIFFTLFDDAENETAIGFFSRTTGEWMPLDSCPKLSQLGLLCISEANGHSLIVTKKEAVQNQMLDDYIVASDIELRLDVPHRNEWQGADWREPISNGDDIAEADEDDSDAVSQVSTNVDQDDEFDIEPNPAWLGDES